MRIASFISILLLALSSSCHAAGPMRSTQPMFKGVELYSWKDPAGDSWRFSVCEGTNRIKILVEIMHKCVIFLDVHSLKQHLAGLAVGESVSWNSPYPELSLPPEATVRDLMEEAAAHQVTVLVQK